MERVYPTTEEKVDRLHHFYSLHRDDMEKAYAEEGNPIQLSAFQTAQIALSVLDHLRDENVVWRKIPDFLRTEND